MLFSHYDVCSLIQHVMMQKTNKPLLFINSTLPARFDNEQYNCYNLQLQIRDNAIINNKIP